MRKVTLWVAGSDGGDGSVSFSFYNTKEEALEQLCRTEEELEGGCFYDDGSLEEITFELDENNKLVESFWVSSE